MLKFRIDILKDNGVITKDVQDFMYQVIDYLADQYPAVTQEQATMFITHLAMATQRILAGTIAEGMQAAIFEEVMKHAGYDNALQVLSYIEQHSVVKYPESERQYLVLHLCSMF